MFITLVVCCYLFTFCVLSTFSISEFEMMKEHFGRIDNLKKGLVASKETAKMWGYIGMLLHVGEQKWHRGGSNQEAIVCFDTAIAYTDPNDHNSLHDYYLYKSFTYEHLGKIQEAMESLKYALKHARTKAQFAMALQYQGW